MGKNFQIWANETMADIIIAKHKASLAANPEVTLSRFLGNIVESYFKRNDPAIAQPILHLAEVYCAGLIPELTARQLSISQQNRVITDVLSSLAHRSLPKSPITLVPEADLWELAHTLNTYRSWLVLMGQDASPRSVEIREGLLHKMAVLIDSLMGRSPINSAQEAPVRMVAEPPPSS